MFRYSPYWVRPQQVLPSSTPPTQFGAELVYLDYGYAQSNETNKLVSLNGDELAITNRAKVKGIKSAVRLASGSAPSIVYDHYNDNIVVCDVNPSATEPFKLSSFDPRSQVLNWSVTLPASYTFLPSSTSDWYKGSVTETLTWIRTSTNLRAYNSKTGDLVYDFVIPTTVAVVGGTNNVPVSVIRPVSDNALMIGISFLNAHNGGAVAPYQAHVMVPLTSTTFQVVAVPGIPGVVGSYVPANYQQFTYADAAVNDILVVYSTTANNLLSCGKFNLTTGTFTPLITAGANQQFSLSYHRADAANPSSGKIWFNGTSVINGVSTLGLLEFSYPDGNYLGTYGSRIQGTGTATTGTVISNNIADYYIFHIVGDRLFSYSTTYRGFHEWTIGSYTREPQKVMPINEATNVNNVRNNYFANLDTPSGAITSFVPLRPFAKYFHPDAVISQVPDIVGTLSPESVITLTLWRKISWVKVIIDSINTSELFIVNDGLNETAVGWLYDATGRQVTNSMTFPLLMSTGAPGTYYLALINVKNDTTSLYSPSNTNFNVIISNSPTVIPHNITIGLSSNYK